MIRIFLKNWILYGVSPIAVLEQLLKEVEDLKKKQPKDPGDRIEALRGQISGLEGQISKISKQIEQTSQDDRTDEVIAKLNAIHRKSQIWEPTGKVEKKFNYYDLILWGTAAAIVCFLVVLIWEMESVKKDRDKYEYYSNMKQGNFMKYRYLKLFGNQNTQ